MQSTGRSCRRHQGGPRWTATVWEQLAIRRETLAAARLIRRDFGLSDVRGIDSLVELVSSRRGKTIKVLYVALPSRVSAFCVATPNLDFIVVDVHASELTQLHAIAHELGHFLFDDTEEASNDLEADDPLPRELAQQLVPALNPDAVSRYFQRSHYNSKKERRVEAFATVMLERYIALRQTNAEALESTFTHRRTGV
ncbi:ImmA/IrrE family metallo-endopeptidase [Streptomyces europaeiscabiei]|uniref:ImmA/IrrE family metallo-endopeptidase n=1 Tax=Streptomyces europaeiscabiei TaxID=146819 RepID=UPI0038F714C1